MTARQAAVLVIGVCLGAAAPAPALAQATRLDAIWARTTAGAPIVLDGILNEPAWGAAETKVLKYGYDNGIPGSGYVLTSAVFAPTDTSVATLKFLVAGDTLYLGAVVQDKSIGGSGQFNYMDGLLMGLKDHGPLTGFPKPVMEYLYSWWYPRQFDLLNPCNNDSARGNPPLFKGRWAPDPVCDETGAVATRSAAQIQAWDAVTVVNGISNSDTLPDVGYTIEMKFDLAVMGYHVSQPGGDIVEWNVQVYDSDYFWPPGGTNFFRGRNWWQGPWGATTEHNEVRIYSRPDVTINSGAAPVIPPELKIPNADALAAPTINGTLAEAIWSQVPGFDIRWADEALRATYPGVGKYRSGQWQPVIEGGEWDVVDGGDATVKYFVKGDLLYLGFDVRDKYVQDHTLVDRRDGFTVSIDDRGVRDPLDHNLQGRGLSFIVSPAGTATAQDYLPSLISAGKATVALALKPGTTVANDNDQDAGYTAELSVNLTGLGYPTGLGDRSLFLGIALHDADTFTNGDSYATRTWWFREREEQCCPAWVYLDATPGLVGVDDGGAPGNGRLSRIGSQPNPFRLLTHLEFTLAKPSEVALQVFDLQGRVVLQRGFEVFAAGAQRLPVQLPNAKSGIYLYRLQARDRGGRDLVATSDGKMMLLH